MDQSLQTLALAYAAALVEYYEWLPARESGFRGDQARFRQAEYKMYMAQEKLNCACKAAAARYNNTMKDILTALVLAGLLVVGLLYYFDVLVQYG